jgi:hypothetical protein
MQWPPSLVSRYGQKTLNKHYNIFIERERKSGMTTAFVRLLQANLLYYTFLQDQHAEILQVFYFFAKMGSFFL